jgi:Co/Zn/Cd efflux system component
MSIHKHIDSSADEEERHIHQGRAHAHLPAKFGRAFAIGTTLNLGYVAIQAVFGIAANSLALLADAGHNLGDVFGLLLAWSAVHLGQRAPTERRTYGMKRSSILATNVHHLHIWPLSTTETALTVHLVKSDASSNDGLINRLNSDLNRRFGINHTTIQFEQVCASNECEPSAATPHSELNHDSTSSNR